MDNQQFYSKFIFAPCLTIIICLFFSTFCLSQNCNDLAIDDITNPGMYNVATLVESDGLRNGPDYSGATVYYPTNASPPFPAIAIVPGFFSAESTVAAWGPFLASHGIVTMTIGTNSLFDDSGDRAVALLDGLETIRQENIRAGSPLMGNIDAANLAVGGWSMGGGGAQIAAVTDPSLRAVMALCPWLASDSNSAANLNHAVPLLILSGENDPTAPPASHADIHYDNTPATSDKLIFEIANGDHSVANDPANANGDIGKIGLSWLKFHLIGDDCYCPLVLDTPSTASKYETTQICLVSEVCPSIITEGAGIISDGTYQAGQALESEGTIPTGGAVTYRAGVEIFLNQGFSVEQGAIFEALIEGCTP